MLVHLLDERNMCRYANSQIVFETLWTLLTLPIHFLRSENYEPIIINLNI